MNTLENYWSWYVRTEETAEDRLEALYTKLSARGYDVSNITADEAIAIADADMEQWNTPTANEWKVRELRRAITDFITAKTHHIDKLHNLLEVVQHTNLHCGISRDRAMQIQQRITAHNLLEELVTTSNYTDFVLMLREVEV